MGLTVEKEVEGSTVTLFMKGMLDISTSNVIAPYLKEIHEGVSVLIIDFSELEFIDSTGIGSIIDAIHLSQELNFTLKLQGVNQLTHDVFEMVGLFEILEVINGEVH